MDKYTILAELVKQVAQAAGDERASKCGYDLLYALAEGRETVTSDAWRSYLADVRRQRGVTETERHGVWVPAIPL